MGLFSRKKSEPARVQGSWPASEATAVAVPAAPAFDDPEDVTRWQAFQSTASSLTAVVEKYEQCFTSADMMEKAYAMAEAEFVNGTQQAPASRATFRNVAQRYEGTLESQLAELQLVTSTAQDQWANLLFVLPGPADGGLGKVVNWWTSHKLDATVLSGVMANSMFVNCNFGTTRQSFWAENERITSILNSSGQ